MCSTILQVLKVLLTAVASTKFRGMLFKRKEYYHFSGSFSSSTYIWMVHEFMFLVLQQWLNTWLTWRIILCTHIFSQNLFCQWLHKHMSGICCLLPSLFCITWVCIFLTVKPFIHAVHGEPLLGVIRVCYNIALHRYFSYHLRVSLLNPSSTH